MHHFMMSDLRANSAHGFPAAVSAYEAAVTALLGCIVAAIFSLAIYKASDCLGFIMHSKLVAHMENRYRELQVCMHV